MDSEIVNIANQFLKNTSDLKVTPFGNGHINNTYKVDGGKEKSWLLQKINSTAFTDPSILIKNHQELLRNYDFKNEIEIPILINEKSPSYLVIDKKGNSWRLLNFFTHTLSLDIVENETQAEEAGKAYGSFLLGCRNCPISKFKDPIPDFHNLRNRIKLFNEAIDKNKSGRLKNVKSVVDFYVSFSEMFSELETHIKQNSIPLRIVHNDTKINNLLFRENKAVAVVDLDTVAPGLVLYDYGDAIRTLANTTFEDDKNLENVQFSIQWFESFTKGYLQKIKSILTNTEKSFLWQAPFLMTFIMGVRFLTDYLDGDKYYKTQYDEHNLVRSKVQMTLLDNMIKKRTEIELIIDKYLHNL